MKILIAIALLFSVLPASAYCPSSYSSCDYYQCAEQHNPCGKEGYWIGWGYRYCEKFLQSEQSYSIEAGQWLRENRRCLQDRAEQMASDAKCSEIRKGAMESHVGCYVDTGFCELDLKDRMAVLWSLKSALAAPEAWIEGIRLDQACKQRHRQL